MTIKLLHHSPLWLASHAIRMSRDNHDKSDTVNTNDNIGEKDASLIERIGNKHKHKSVLEQLVYWFDIDGISRACLQELARHRTARLTVKSSRYTLKELKDDNQIDIRDYCVVAADITTASTLKSLQEIRSNLKNGMSNDLVKYLLPESFKTRLQWQIDGRNLQNFLELRTNKDALWEIRQLAYAIYEALPSEHKYLYIDYLYKENNNE